MKTSANILLLLISAALSAQSSSQMLEPGPELSIDLFNASENENISCYRIPSLVTAPNGDILAAIDERVPSCGDLLRNPDINIVMRRSSDNGHSWSKIERVVDLPDGQSASDPSMVVDKYTGEIFLFYNYMDHDNEKDVFFQHLISSNDNGQSWSEARDITSEITDSDWHNDFKFITSGKGFQTSNGKIIHCIVNLDKGMHLFGSNDHGKSWILYEPVISPADESKVIELEDGTWMINSRVNGAGLRYVHRSADNGITWESYADSSLKDPSCNASIIRYLHPGNNLSRNLVLFSNTSHPHSRENLSVKYSTDNGETWSKGKMIYKGSSAYSSMTVLKNGNIGLLFEKDNYQENIFVSFSLEWLLQ